MNYTMNSEFSIQESEEIINDASIPTSKIKNR